MPEESIGQHIDDFMSVNLKELQFLHDLAKEMQSIVEIGSCKGRSTYALCSSGCPSVIAVDAFEIYPETLYDDFQRNVGHFENLKLYKVLSEDAAELIDEADMIFIDGNHSYDQVILDLSLWTPKAKKLICGHDFRDETWTDVPEAVRKYFGREPEVFETIWLIRKGNDNV